MNLISVCSLVVCLSSSTGLLINNDQDISHYNSKEAEDVANRLFKNLILNKNFARIPILQKQFKIYNISKELSNKNMDEFTRLSNITVVDFNEKLNFVSYDIVRSILNVSLNFNIEDPIRKEFESNLPPLIIHNNKSDVTKFVPMNSNKDISMKIEKLRTETVSYETNSDLIRRSNRQRRKAIEQEGKIDLGVWKHKRHASEVSNRARRMYQGKRAWIKYYPFMVSVHENGKFVCSGCIIRKDLVISAASCFEKVQQDRNDKHSITLRVGSNYVSNEGFVVFAIRAIFHPSYDPVSLRNNLVLLNVNNDAFSKYPWIKRIKYRHSNATSFTDDGKLGSIKILGWGEQDHASIPNTMTDNGTLPVSRQLLQENTSHNIPLSFDQLEAYDLEECMDIYSRYFVTKNNLCAGFLLTGNGACKYDVGGPGIQNGLLLGIISFGPALCGTRDKPTVFTRLAPYVTWIHEVVHKIIPKLQKKASLVKQEPLDNSGHLRKHLILDDGTPSRQNNFKTSNVFDETISQISDIHSFNSSNINSDHIDESDGTSADIAESSGKLFQDKKYWMDIIPVIATKSTSLNSTFAPNHHHKRKRRKNTPPGITSAVLRDV